MTHFGILCPPASGHIHPMTALGYELQKRGHRVTLFGPLDTQAKTLEAGLDFWAIGESEFPLGSIAPILSHYGQMNRWTALQCGLRLAVKTATILLQEGPKAIKQAGAEALLVDQLLPGGGTVADFLDIPFISCTSSLPANQEEGVPPYVTSWQYSPAWWSRLRNKIGYGALSLMVQPVRKVITEYRQAWHLPPYSYPNDAFSRLAQVSQQVIEFEFPRQHLPKCFHFTGPFLNPTSRKPVPFPFEKLTGQPLIYASLGTVVNCRGEIFDNIASACVGLDAQLVISLGGGMSLESSELPGKPLVVKYAPQLELLQKATLAITHAGFNTVLESLSNGVSMVAIPISSDHPGVAARLVWTGAGEVVPLNRLSVSRLRAAIQQVLTKDSYRNNAMRLQEGIRRAGGVTQAANIIEQVISSRKTYSSPK